MLQRVEINFDNFANICHFFKDDETINYGCTHNKCGDCTTDNNGKSIGRCFSWACPFVLEADRNEDNVDSDTDIVVSAKVIENFLKTVRN